MKNVAISEYERILEIQKQNGNSYHEHFKGSRKTLIVYGREVVSTLIGGNSLHLGELSNRQFASFLGTFKKSLYNQLKKNSDLQNLKVVFEGTSKGKNRERFKDLPVNSFYYNIDISSAYWQIAHRLGYISTPFFVKYIDKDEYKAIKRLCFSFLSRSNFRKYYVGNESYTIVCENQLEKMVYQNVRKELYNIIQGAINLCGNDYIDFNIDAISVTKEKRKLVIDYFEKQKIKIKIFPVQKLNASEYTVKTVVRKF